MMTSRERLLAVLRGEIPDRVPVSPDISNMVPCRLTGKPFWDLYLYQDPPPWVAYIEAVKYYGFDSLMDGYVQVRLPCDMDTNAMPGTTVIVDENEDRIVTQGYTQENGKKTWIETVSVYHAYNPPSRGVNPVSIGLSPVPSQWKPIEGVKEWPKGAEALELANQLMGNHGLVGVFCGTSRLIGSEKHLYDYFDNPSKYHELAEKTLELSERRFHALMALEVKPDFICTGSSGTLIFQTPQMTRELTLPIIKRMAELAAKHGTFSHIHSCGPEKELVRMCAEETQLTVIDPLEIPPMGDCVLSDIKRLYGHRLVLKGNLHTTEVMLRGTPAQVMSAAREAMAQAAEGGRFILSTGDQCGRDTPDENLRALIDAAKEYGQYKQRA